MKGEEFIDNWDGQSKFLREIGAFLMNSCCKKCGKLVQKRKIMNYEFVKKIFSLSLRQMGNHSFRVLTTRQRYAKKLAAVGGGEDELLVADIPGYDAVFVVVILIWFTEHLGDGLHRAAVRSSVMLHGSLFSIKGNARNRLAGSFDLKFSGIAKIDSLESVNALAIRSAPKQGIDRRLGVKDDLSRDHSGTQAVHVKGVWGLGRCPP